MTAPSRLLRPIAALTLLLALAGCGQKTEQAAETTPEPAPEAAVGGSTMTFSWDQASNCLKFSPPSIPVNSGSSANFNTSTDDTVWVTAPAGCFSAADTTFAVVRGSNDAHPVAQTPGTYNLTISPAICSPTGGPGPSVIVDSGAAEGAH